MVSIAYQTSTGRLATLAIDATLRQEAALSVEVTKYPVEDGSTISDHAISKPDTYRMEGVISSTPVARAEGGVATWSPTRAGDARTELESIERAKRTITIDTGSVVYTDMVMESLSFPKDGTTGDALHFSATFTKITTAETKTTSILKTAAAKKPGGKKATEKAPEPVTKKKSALKSAADFIRGRSGRKAIPNG